MVSRTQIIVRGVGNRCPNCGAHSLFQPGARFKINDRCPNCGMKIDRGDGFFLGPFVINYGLTAFGFVVPVVLLYFFQKIGATVALIAAGAGAFVFPVLLYRLSWSWWLMVYFFFLPQKLPGNHDALNEDEEE